MVVSRMRLFPFELETRVRIVGLAACVANAKDLGDWIGASLDTLIFYMYIYNFTYVYTQIYIHTTLYIRLCVCVVGLAARVANAKRT